VSKYQQTLFLLEIRREGCEDEERVRMTASLQICSDNRHLWYAEDINYNRRFALHT